MKVKMTSPVPVTVRGRYRDPTCPLLRKRDQRLSPGPLLEGARFHSIFILYILNSLLHLTSVFILNEM